MSEAPSRGLLTPEEREWVEQGYRESIERGPHLEAGFRGVLDHTLGHPGGLTRAQLSYAVARAFEADREVARELAIGIEYLHTASLLFDDLPAMDDASERRGAACPHRVFGEGATVLAALALITEAYRLLWRSMDRGEAGTRERASEMIAECLGVEGMLNGQALDLAFGASHRRGSEVLAAAEGKTVALLRLTLILPALLGGADEAAIEALSNLASSWGHAYQIVDDFRDDLMGRDRTGKTGSRDAYLGRPNLPRAEGGQQALRVAWTELERAESHLARLRRSAPDIPAVHRIFDVLRAEVSEIQHLLATRAVA